MRKALFILIPKIIWIILGVGTTQVKRNLKVNLLFYALEIKRNKRKAEGDKKHQIIIEQLENSYISNSKHHQNYYEIGINFNSNRSKFTDKNNEFWEIHLAQNNKYT